MHERDASTTVFTLGDITTLEQEKHLKKSATKLILSLRQNTIWESTHKHNSGFSDFKVWLNLKKRLCT
jgi:hypothetical protein